MNCLAGNGGTSWTLDCSLWMCGSPLRNCRNSWCRLGRWIGRPSPSVPAQPLGPCPVVALPALQWDVAWKLHRAEPRDVKGPTKGGEERKEVRQQPSSTKFLCKQKLHGAEPRNLKGLSKQSQERMKKRTEAEAKQHRAPLQPGQAKALIQPSSAKCPGLGAAKGKRLQPRRPGWGLLVLPVGWDAGIASLGVC
ncbi:uncharacterized protein LOC127467466 [Manacus candei]|uniref:uncharacterized protein LOC127467466 n=1 Tax=Manacus candei TaxID=415023 RepID=UPI0022261DDD|nr:uncharacterized protein LOC127467466 [Manacus candei]